MPSCEVTCRFAGHRVCVCWVGYNFRMLCGPSQARGGLLEGCLILGRGAPSSEGRRGDTLAPPNAPAGGRWGRPSGSPRAVPGNIDVAR